MEISQNFVAFSEYMNFKSLAYSGAVDNLYLLDRVLVMYFSTPFLLQNRYWILRRLPASFIQTVWQYGLLNFQTGGTKLDRFLPKNQHTQRKLLNFENWVD